MDCCSTSQCRSKETDLAQFALSVDGPNGDIVPGKASAIECSPMPALPGLARTVCIRGMLAGSICARWCEQLQTYLLEQAKQDICGQGTLVSLIQNDDAVPL